MFKPHVTVACVVQAQDQFLLVEETINNKVLWNQPAGHLEANETLLQAAGRELYEETGLRAQMQRFVQLHQWIAPDGTAFLRFLFALDLPEPLACNPQDKEIDRCLWLDAQQIIDADNLRSPLVAESIRCYLRNQSYPLEILSAFDWPFTEDAK